MNRQSRLRRARGTRMRCPSGWACARPRVRMRAVPQTFDIASAIPALPVKSRRQSMPRGDCARNESLPSLLSHQHNRNTQCEVKFADTQRECSTGTPGPLSFHQRKPYGEGHQPKRVVLTKREEPELRVSTRPTPTSWIIDRFPARWRRRPAELRYFRASHVHRAQTYGRRPRIFWP